MPQVIIIAPIADYQQEVHLTIVRSNLFHPGQSVGIAASGGKDSTVLAHVMTKLNAERGYGLRLCLLSIDEGITGYRDDSLETVKRNADQYALQLTVLSYQQLYRTPPLTNETEFDYYTSRCTGMGGAWTPSSAKLATKTTAHSAACSDGRRSTAGRSC